MTCHVFVLDIVMFLTRFVVFSTLHFWHEFVLCVSRAGTLLGYGWCNVVSWLVQCCVMFGAMLGDGWHKVG